MTQQELDEIVAHELGYLDNKYKMGYNPPRSSTESYYRKGYQSFSSFTEKKEVIMCSYRGKTNWGNY